LYFFVSAALLDSLGFQCQLLLVVIVIEYCRLVLRAPGTSGGVMFMPENIQKRFVRNASRVEIDLDRFAVIADTAIGWIFFVAARISDAGSNDAI
jgi:hypothetical protein